MSDDDDDDDDDDDVDAAAAAAAAAADDDDDGGFIYLHPFQVGPAYHLSNISIWSGSRTLWKSKFQLY